MSRLDSLVSRLRKDDRISHLSKLFLIYLYNICDELGSGNHCFFSLSDYAGETGISKGSLSDAILPELDKAGYITYVRGNQGSKTSVYIRDVLDENARVTAPGTLEYRVPGFAVVTLKIKPDNLDIPDVGK